MYSATDSAMVTKTARATFYKDLPANPGVDFTPFVTELTTDSGEIDIAHWGALPLPRKFDNTRAIRAIKNAELRIRTETWDHSAGWDYRTFKRDKTGTAAKRAGGMAAKAQQWYAQQYSQLLEAGTGTTRGACYDAKALFSTSHDESGSNQSNLISVDIAAPTDPTPTEFESSFKQARRAIRGFKDDQGNPQVIADGLIAMVPSGMETAAMQVLNANGTVGGNAVSQVGTRADSAMTSGSQRGQAEVVVNPWFAASDAWYLLAKTGPGDAGPLIRLMEEDWFFQTFDPFNSPEHSRNLKIEMHGTAEIGFGYGVFWRVVKIQLT